MIDYKLINNCLECVPVFVGCFIVCMLLITICVCMLILEKVMVSFTHRKHDEKLNDVKSILKELHNDKEVS